MGRLGQDKPAFGWELEPLSLLLYRSKDLPADAFHGRARCLLARWRLQVTLSLSDSLSLTHAHTLPLSLSLSLSLTHSHPPRTPPEEGSEGGGSFLMGEVLCTCSQQKKFHVDGLAPARVSRETVEIHQLVECEDRVLAGSASWGKGFKD